MNVVSGEDVNSKLKYHQEANQNTGTRSIDDLRRNRLPTGTKCFCYDPADTFVKVIIPDEDEHAGLQSYLEKTGDATLVLRLGLQALTRRNEFGFDGYGLSTPPLSAWRSTGARTW